MTTLDVQFRKVLRDHAQVAGASERFALTSVRLLATNLDVDTDVDALTSDDADRRARRYRLIAAYALRGASICDDHADSVREPIASCLAPT